VKRARPTSLALCLLVVSCSSNSTTAPYGSPVALVVHSGDNARANTRSATSPPPAVRVLDDRNRSVPGIGVSFEIVTGKGSVTIPNATSGVDGVAVIGGDWELELRNSGAQHASSDI
jgi:hypothetical protein